MAMLEDPLSLAGKIAIVTGGGTGIGAATARLFARHGAAGVVLAARTGADLDRVSDELLQIAAEAGNADLKVLSVPTNVKDEDAVVALVETTMAEFGRIDIVINNAGGMRMGPLEDTPTRAWDAVFDLNAKGPFLLTREAGKHMIASGNGGVFINVSSNAGVTGVQGGAGYSAAKAGLQMFTKVTAAEWGRYGIRANCVAVGAVASERAVAAWEVAKLDPAAMGKGSAVGRVGQPLDVAYPILFLCSEAASYVSGQTFSVDGGQLLGGAPRD